jgi:protein-tyrosine phosphatase
MIQVCFVCLGNICRSPLAEGVFKSLVAKEGLEDRISTASAGVGSWHIGEPPDARMMKTAHKNGIVLNSRARQFQKNDFRNTDLILAMDESNLQALEQMSPSLDARQKLFLFRSFDQEHQGDLNVPDPYYGGEGGFDHVFEIVDRTCPRILEFIKDRSEL